MRQFLPILLFCCLASSLQAQTKRALIVAIGNYPDNSNWETINSLNDVPLLQQALTTQGFLPANIKTLIDAQATKKGIETALLQLVDISKPGDIVMIHFSSHGEQIEDDNINEEVDGLDETIVPYDAVFTDDRKLVNKAMAGYFRDDAFGEVITRLRNKLGRNGDILVTIDACHSGTGTRGGGPKVRGNKAPMVSPNFNKKRMSYKDTSGVFKDKGRTQLNPDAATYIVLSASQAEENNYECYDDEMNPAGSLSYAISKTLTSLTGTITYRSLFAQVEDVLRSKAPKQKPVMEGDGTDRELFGGRYQQQTPYITLNMAASKKDSIQLNAGTVAGVTPGSEISFYPGGTTDPANKTPLQKGKVIAATNFTSIVQPDSADESLLKKIPWAFLTQRTYGNEKIRLNIDSLKNDTQKKLKDDLASFRLVDYNATADLYIGRSTDGKSWALRFPGNGELFADTIDLNKPESLKQALIRFSRYRYLNGLKIDEQELSARVELVFLDAAGKEERKAAAEHTKFGRLELKEGDIVYLKVVNTGRKNFYVNILDLQPDGWINPIIPNINLKDKNRNPAPITVNDCLVKTNDSLFRKDYQILIGPPYGGENFKVFLSTQSLDLPAILLFDDETNSKPRGGGALNNLAKIFNDSKPSTLGRRGGSGSINTANDGTIFSFNFMIVPK